MKLAIRILGGLALSAMLMPAVTQAVILNPNSGIVFAVNEPDPAPGSTLLASMTTPYSSASFAGLLTSRVFVNDASSPFGANSLTFTYDFIVNGGPQTVNQFTVTSFAGFLTDVSFTFNPAAVPLVAPSYFTRSAAGDTIRFGFLNEVGAGQQSATLVIQTSATQWFQSIGGLINGSTTDVAVFAPALIPEPTVFALGLLGAAALLIRRKA